MEKGKMGGIMEKGIMEKGKLMKKCMVGSLIFVFMVAVLMGGLAFASSTPQAVPVESGAIYRFLNTVNGDHFYTASSAEANSVGSPYQYEGIGWVRTSVPTPIYRFVNTVTGGHFYTASAAEKASVGPPYLYEGIGWNDSLPNGPVIYRFVNTVTGCHFYTASAAEKASVGPPYLYEGIAWGAEIPIPTIPTTIDIAAIAGVTAPVTGATPVAAITPTAEYTGTVAWSGSPATFAVGTRYTATITLTPEADWTLTGVAANFFTVAGTSTHATNAADSGVVTAVFPTTRTRTIDIAAIAGVTAPVAGATPVTKITPTAEYTGTVAWSPTDNPFVGSTAYVATITLTPEAGWTLTGVGADFFTVAGTLVHATNAADSGVVTAVFRPAPPISTINIAAIPGVTVPVAGATPVTAITPTAQYTGTVVWTGNPATFVEGTTNVATITLTPKWSYTLTGVGANFFTVAGALYATNAANSGVVTAVFPPAIGPRTIDIAAIAGVTAPLAGGTPVPTITATAEYTGTVAWSPANNPFVAGVYYTATITLLPKAGWTLTGVGANFFTVAGTLVPATNAANSGVVTAVFPVTPTTINIARIDGVTVPVAGATPVTAITPTAQYTGTVAWSPTNNPFVVGRAYVATITLTPKAGYTLTGVGANFFWVPGELYSTNAANSGVVTAVFPST